MGKGKIEVVEFEASGLPCRAVEASLGYWCGYVGIGKNHPWHGMNYDSDVKVPDSVRDRAVDPDKVGAINLLASVGRAEAISNGIMPIVLAIDVHGGITFSDNQCGGNPKNGLWWFGFDCAHSGDANSPEDEARGRGTYRTLDYVKSECAAMANQLAAFAKARGET